MKAEETQFHLQAAVLAALFEVGGVDLEAVGAQFVGGRGFRPQEQETTCGKIFFLFNIILFYHFLFYLLLFLLYFIIINSTHV